MKKNNGLFLFSLCPLIPATSRLAYGLVLTVVILVFYGAGLLFRELIRRMRPGTAGPAIELLCLACTAMLLTVTLEGLYPIIAIAITPYIYVSAFSFIVLVSVDSFSLRSRQRPPILPFIPTLMVFSALREMVGNGTVSLPSAAGIVEFSLLQPGTDFKIIAFWGTAGGALVLAGVCSWLYRVLVSRIGGRS